MDRDAALARVLQRRLVAVLRATSGEQLVDVAEALLAGGVDCVEVTFTVPGALRVIEHVADRLGDRVLLGAGTVLDGATARAALLAGAEFIVTPVVKADVIETARRYSKLVMPGAFTPTEVLTAWELGADVVKVFPSDIGGPAYLKALRGPLPQIRMMPTGGVDLNTAAAFLDAGACALGVGGSLASAAMIERGEFAAIESRARAFAQIVQQWQTKSRDQS